MKTALLTALLIATSAISATAQTYLEYDAPVPFQRAQHSFLSGASVFIPPYEYPFPVRVYTTPPQQPFYNVPPYAVISPY